MRSPSQRRRIQTFRQLVSLPVGKYSRRIHDMSINILFVAAMAAAIAFVTARSLWGRIGVFVGLLVLFVVGVTIWNVAVSHRSVR